MIRRPPRSTRTDTLFPYTTLFRSLRLGDPSLLVRLDRQRTFTDKRMIKLRNLVTLRQIGIEIILAVEARPFVDLRLDRHAGTHRLADALAVRHRAHSEIGRASCRERVCQYV